MYRWKEYLVPHLTYQRPFLVNAQEFIKRPSDDGTLPVDPYTGELKYPNGPEPDLLSETSEEEQPDEERLEKVQLDKEPLEEEPNSETSHNAPRS